MLSFNLFHFLVESWHACFFQSEVRRISLAQHQHSADLVGYIDSVSDYLVDSFIIKCSITLIRLTNLVAWIMSQQMRGRRAMKLFYIHADKVNDVFLFILKTVHHRHCKPRYWFQRKLFLRCLIPSLSFLLCPSNQCSSALPRTSYVVVLNQICWQWRYQFRMNLKTGEVKQKNMGELNVDFPNINEKYVGRYVIENEVVWLVIPVSKRT